MNFWSVTAEAHFLWLVPRCSDAPPRVEVYFSESAEPDDPALLKPFVGHNVVVLGSGRSGERQEVSLEPGESALQAQIDTSAQGPLAMEATYGVVRRGGEPFLLQYFAKAYLHALPGRWKRIGHQDLARLEITPRVEGEDLVLLVTWEGKPSPGDQIVLEGPGLEERIQGVTDDRGELRCRLPQQGLYSIRARHVASESGVHNDEEYTSVRSYATLALNFTPFRLVASERSFPDLPLPLTSFGGAVVGDCLYLYGGHAGEAHHYTIEDQSDRFWKLPLRSPNSAWEELPRGPKLTGVALVAHQNQLYRIGGFTVQPGERNLQSQASFARFDPATGVWRDLPDLPEPRSSHDAAVLDDTLFVIGGWNLQGPEEPVWHATAWSCHLTQDPLQWTELPPPPFRRRALSVAAHRGKIYVLGGMEINGRPTTRVDVYDPSSKTWSEGPSLIGAGMEGFGNSSYSVAKHLLASTLSGAVQQLSDDGSAWEVVGQLRSPRFFHRLLPMNDELMLVVGGAHMELGKIPSIEVWKYRASSAPSVSPR